MVTIRPGNESPTPPTEWMEGLPENAQFFVVLGSGEVLAVFEKVEVNGETQYVERLLDADSAIGILRRLLWRSVGISEGQLKSLLVGKLNEQAHQPGE